MLKNLEKFVKYPFNNNSCLFAVNSKMPQCHRCRCRRKCHLNYIKRRQIEFQLETCLSACHVTNFLIVGKSLNSRFFQDIVLDETKIILN